MSRRNSINRQAILYLILKLEDMENRGGVRFQTELPYHDLINYFEREYLIERALQIVEYALDQFGATAKFFLRKAELLLQNKQAEQALATLDIAEALEPKLLKTALLRAEGFAALDMCLEAVALLDALKPGATDEEISEIYTQEALIYHQRREYEREFYLLKAALQENPANQEALSRLWYCVEASRKYEESVRLNEEILEDDPFCSLAWFNLGSAYQYLCMHQESIEAFEYAYLTNEHFEFAYRSCADVCLYNHNYQKALQCYQEVLERFDPDEDLLLNIGLCHEKLGNFAIARSFYEKAATFNPMCDEALYHIGHCYAGQKLWQKAVRFYIQAIRLENRNEIYFASLAEAYWQTGMYKKAETFFREATEIAPDEPSYWIRLAHFYMDMQRLDDALVVLEEAEEYTYGSQFLYYRSAFLFKMGKKRQALLALEEALCEDYYAHESLFNLLPVLEKDTEVKAVISIFQPE